jgi:hypothetical protein
MTNDDTFKEIIKRRRSIWAGIIVSLAVGIGIAILRSVNADQLTAGEAFGSIALGAAAAVPAGIAWLSLDRRPGLLPAAAYSAILVGLISIVMLPPGLIAAFLWFSAGRGAAPAAGPRWPGLRRIGIAAMVIVSVMALFVHADPACSETLADGTVRATDPAQQGFAPGWGFGVGSVGTSSGVTSTLSSDVVSSSCSSDTIVPVEALVSLALSAATLGLASRWPVNERNSTPRAAANSSHEL